MILPITIQEMQRLNIACKRVLGNDEWTRRSDAAWESLRGLEFVTADMLESAIMDGFGQEEGARFDREEAAALLALADYMGLGFVGEHTKTIANDSTEGGAMTDRETLDKAKALFTGATQGDMIAREVIAIVERNAKKAALWAEFADQKDKAIADLRSQRDELWAMLTPLCDAVLFARAQRRPMGIGQDSEIGRPTVTIEVCPRYGREKHNPGFHLEADTLGPGDAEGPSATKRIAVALLRLAYAVADKVRLQP